MSSLLPSYPVVNLLVRVAGIYSLCRRPASIGKIPECSTEQVIEFLVGILRRISNLQACKRRNRLMICEIPQWSKPMPKQKVELQTSGVSFNNLSGERCMFQQAQIHRKHVVGTILVSETW